MTARRWPDAAIVVAFVLSIASPLPAQPLGALTPHDIEAAILWGETGDPTPYQLHHHPGRQNPVVMGSIYTPYVRVALAARAAWQSGATLKPVDLPATLTEPVVWVALRWYCCDRDRPDPATFTPRVPFDYHVAALGDRALRPMPWLRPLESPQWVRSDLSPLVPLGALSYPDVVLLVGYRPEVVARGGDIVIYRERPSQTLPDATDTELRIGRVDPGGLVARR